MPSSSRAFHYGYDLAGRPATCAQIRRYEIGAAHWRRPCRRALHYGGARHRSHRRQARPRALGGIDGECGRLSEPLGRSAEPRPAHRPQPLGHPRWLEGASQSGDADLWHRRPHSPVSRPQAAEHRGASPGGPAPLGAGDRGPGLQGGGRDGATPAPGSGAAPRGPPPERSRERPRRARVHAHHPTEGLRSSLGTGMLGLVTHRSKKSAPQDSPSTSCE